MRHRIPSVVLIVLVCLAAAPALGAPATQPNDSFLRFVDDGKGGGKLQTAIVSYKNPAGVTVHLVAAVHVADKSYYDGLNETFKGYDALLYEMVKPKDMGVPEPGAAPHSGVSMLQHLLKNFLDLDFQLDDVDYSAANFVHADLDAETFQQMQEDRGESILGLMLQAVIQEMFKPEDPNAPAPEVQTAQLLAALTAPDRPRQMKLLLGRQFEDLDAKFEGLDSGTGTVLVTERNKAALKTLGERINHGDKNIGIFYGAAHMKGIEQRLLNDFHFKRADTEWRSAWDMSR